MIMVALCNTADHYIFALWFLSSFFFSSPNLSAKKVAKNRHLGTIAQLQQDISSQLRHVSTIGKKLVTQQYLLHMSLQYGELRPSSS